MAVSYSPVAEVAQAGPTVSVESPRTSELKLVSAKKSLHDGKVDELRNKRSRLQQGGGKQRIEKQHAAGKLTARERVAGLVDPDSFQEIGLFAKHRATLFGMAEKETPADGVVTGCATIDGRPVHLASQDFTVLGGAAGEVTVGGFYKHFGSRDDLVAEALGSAQGPWKRLMDAAVSGGPPVTYDSLIDSYLSEAHRNDRGRGCAVGALAGDVVRSDKRTRAVATRLISERFEWLANSIRHTGEEDKGAARSRAILTYCALVGAIIMARTVSDQELSREILKTVVQLLKTSPRHRGR